jgi:hypothetical protein
MKQQTKENLLEQELQQLDTEYTMLQSQLHLSRICELRHKRKQLQEKLRNCKWDRNSFHPTQASPK